LVLFLRQFDRKTVDGVVESREQNYPDCLLAKYAVPTYPSVTNHPSIKPFLIIIFNLGYL